MKQRMLPWLLSVTAAAMGASAQRLDPSGLDPAAGVSLASDPVGRGTASVPAELERSRAELDRDQRALRREFADLDQATAQARERMLLRGRAYTKLSRAGLLPVAGGVEALMAHAARVERLRASLVSDLGLTRALGEKRRALEGKTEALTQRAAALELKERAVAQAQTALLEARDRELAFRRAFESSSAAPYAAIYGAGVGPVDPGELALGFAGMKGRLPIPVPGRAEIRPVHRAGADGSGLEVVAPVGTPVRAVYPGRIAFADRYPAYGNTVILDHGGGYYTVSANLETIAVATGQEVAVGARLGTVGLSNHGPNLYFEVRLNARTLEPAEWFGI